MARASDKEGRLKDHENDAQKREVTKDDNAEDERGKMAANKCNG